MNLASPIPLRARQGDSRAKPPVRSLERIRLQLYLGMMVVDALVLFGSFMLAALVYGEDPLRRAFMLPAQLLLPLFLTIALYNGTYSLPSLQSWKAAWSRALTALLISAALLNFFAFFARLNREFSRVGFVIAMIIAFALFLASRRVFAQVTQRACGASPLNVLVIDDGGPPIELPGAHRVSAAEHDLSPALDDPHSLDRLSRYVANMDQVLVTCPREKRVASAMALKARACIPRSLRSS